MEGEPADQFALSAFTKASNGSVSFNLKADSFKEHKFETFSISIYGSNMDAAYGRPALAQTTFSIIDDDTPQFHTSSGLLVNNFAVGAGGWSSQDLHPRHVADVNGDGFSDIVGFGHAGVLAGLNQGDWLL